MKAKISRKAVSVLCLLVVGINNIVLSKNRKNDEYNIKSQIAKPVFVIEKDDNIEQEINMKSFPIEYNFCIKNYDDTSVNEVEFLYSIELEISDLNFPIKSELYDCNNKIEVELVDGKSGKIELKKNVKEEKNFKIVLDWNDIKGDMAEDVKINLKINAEQKDGVKDEN